MRTAGLTKKDSTALNVKIETQVYRELEDYCRCVGKSKTAAVEDILDSYIKQYFTDTSFETAAKEEKGHK